MSDKPSLYVVEKKEVVILVVLFVLVTVLSFTMGVRYGESVGRKSAKEQLVAENEHSEAPQNRLGGTLGNEKVSPDDEKAPGDSKESTHGEEADSKHEDAGNGHDKAEEHGKEPAKETAKDAHKESHDSPETAAKVEDRSPVPSKEAVDKNSDEYLLGALKDAGVEPPGGKAPKNEKLPQEVKESRSGAFVIQVGSHPSRSEAEAQIKALKQKRVSAEILAPFKDRQGEWHRVVVGNFRNKREADKEAKALKSRGAVTSYYVRRLP